MNPADRPSRVRATQHFAQLAFDASLLLIFDAVTVNRSFSRFL